MQMVLMFHIVVIVLPLKRIMKQIQEVEELRISSIILSTKDDLLLQKLHKTKGGLQNKLKIVITP